MRILLALALTLAVQQPPPRDAPASDAPPVATGTGVIKGRVVAADTGTPIRRAIVTIVGPRMPPLTIYTDGAGRYEARNLPPGDYSVLARPNSFQAQFLPAAPPPLTPDGFPRRIPLANGQTIEWYDLMLPRTGAVTGRIVDEHGDPVAGVSVVARRVGDPPNSGSFRSQPSDEFGRYRVYNLTPGDYHIVAKPFAGLDNLGDGVSLGFVETNYPGTFSSEEAGRVRVRAGQETALSDLHLTYARMLRVRGMVVGSSGARAGAGTMVSLNGNSGGLGVGVDSEGRFSFRPQVPGQYRVTARLLSENGEVTREYGSMSITLTDVDVDDVILVLKPTVSFSGRVSFEGTTAPVLKAGALTVRADPKDRASSQLPVSPAPVAEDLTFTLRNLAGELLIRPNAGVPGAWSLKSVLLGSEDITDAPREFRPEDSGRVQIVLTSRWSEVSGTVTGDDGKPAQRGTVVLFGEDRATWFAESSRMRASGIAPGGRFVMRGLRPGRYYLIALPPGVRWDFQAIDKAELEKLAREATVVVLGEDEQRQVDLRIAAAERHN